uniref:Uncharacterized protein n=1 Tax=Phocoena sinus TaxID=42100 RepID=A0A8C9AXW5_PHOSS
MLGGGAPSAGGEGAQQFNWSWGNGGGFQLLCRSGPRGPRPPALATDVAPACSPARLPLLALAHPPERT